MRILVTGAAGFVGKHATKHLLDRGHDVVALSIDGAPVLTAKPLRADIRDAHVIRRILEAERPDAILHLAAIAFVPAVQRDPVFGFETNATGTLVLLAAAREAALDARIVMVSTAEVYGRMRDAKDPIGEDTPPQPVTLYGASKAAAELVCRAFAEEGLDVVVLRPFNHIGPGQDSAYVVASFAEQIARIERQGGGVLRHGNLDAIRDFTDVRDVVRAYELALVAPRGDLPPGHAFNVCSGVGLSIGSLVDRMVTLARCKIHSETDPSRVRAIDVPMFVGDPRRFHAATEYAPQIAIDTTLSDVLNEARHREARATGQGEAPPLR